MSLAPILSFHFRYPHSNACWTRVPFGHLQIFYVPWSQAHGHVLALPLAVLPLRVPRLR